MASAESHSRFHVRHCSRCGDSCSGGRDEIEGYEPVAHGQIIRRRFLLACSYRRSAHFRGPGRRCCTTASSSAERYARQDSVHRNRARYLVGHEGSTPAHASGVKGAQPDRVGLRHQASDSQQVLLVQGYLPAVHSGFDIKCSYITLQKTKSWTFSKPTFASSFLALF
jgi:hypothetical protein